MFAGSGSMPGTQGDGYVELAVEVFTMLADETRVRIILRLAEGECSVGDLATEVAKTPTAVSQHLAKLRMARMVTTRQDGNHVFYQLANEHSIQLVTDAIHQAEHSVSNSPRHHHNASQDLLRAKRKPSSAAQHTSHPRTPNQASSDSP
ncbi:MAG: ArsR/SmtB family transcription factor [Propionibacteriaceae bacterium]